MANIVPTDLWLLPRRSMPTLIDEMDDLLSFGSGETGALSVSEDDKHVHIEAAMPGIDSDDIEVTYERGMLWIRGQTLEEERDKKRKYYRRAAQEFSYRITVPGDVDPNAEPQAEYKNGMVMITFPKMKSKMPKKITLKKSKTNGENKSKSN